MSDVPDKSCNERHRPMQLALGLLVMLVLLSITLSVSGMREASKAHATVAVQQETLRNVQMMLGEVRRDLKLLIKETRK